MAIFCVHCGVNLVDDYIIKNGEETPNPHVVCGNCGEWAGIPIPKNASSDADSTAFDKSLEEDKDFSVKDGKVNPQ